MRIEKQIVIRTLFSILVFLFFAVSWQVSAGERQIAIRSIQYSSNQGSGGDCFPSPREGSVVTLRGAITALENENSPDFYIQDSSRQWSGIYIYNSSVNISLNVGDSVEVQGTVAEYYGNTELTDIQGISVYGEASQEIVPLVVRTGDFAGGCNQDGEPYEGVLVQLFNVVVTSSPDQYGEWRGDDGSGECIFGDQFMNYTPEPGKILTSIKGIVSYSYSNFKVNPRSLDDIVAAGFAPVIDTFFVQPENPEPGDSLYFFVAAHDQDGSVSSVFARYGDSEMFQDSLQLTWNGDYYTSGMLPELSGTNLLYYQIVVRDDNGNVALSQIRSLLFYTGSGTTDTLTVMTWNLLNFPGSQGEERLPYFRTVVEFVSPDLLVVQEIQTQSSVQLFLQEVLGNLPGSYAAAPWYDGPDSDNMLFFRNDKFFLTNTEAIETPLRYIMAYYLRTVRNSQLVIFSVHLKAGSDYAAERYQEIIALKNYINDLPDSTHLIICGDFNLYSSSEQAYQELINNFPIPVEDPLQAPGNWHINQEFAYLHTQSTRVNTEPDGGSTGGLDDRFDFILPSVNFEWPYYLDVMPGSYEAVGNDGEHFNQAINEGDNTAVPADVADALYHASDHLPVTLKIVDYGVPNAVSGPPLLPSQSDLITYPNPFNSTVTISITANDRSLHKLEVYDLTGRKVWQRQALPPGMRVIYWNGRKMNGEELPSGIYLVKAVTISGEVYITKILLLR